MKAIINTIACSGLIGLTAGIIEMSFGQRAVYYFLGAVFGLLLSEIRGE